MKTCKECDGKGMRVHAQRTVFGTFQTKTACGPCHGEGEIPETPCTVCQGSGVARRKVTVTVQVPAATEDGVTYRVRGAGEAVRGGQSGDMLVRVHVEADNRFERDGDTVLSTARLSFATAALGGTIDVETLDGVVELKIPAGTQGGSEFRLRGKGIPNRRSRGDQVVKVDIAVPKHVSREQRELIEKLNLKEE